MLRRYQEARSTGRKNDRELPGQYFGRAIQGQVSGILDDVVLDCDRVEFSCTDDLTQNIMKVYNSADPDRYVEFSRSRPYCR